MNNDNYRQPDNTPSHTMPCRNDYREKNYKHNGKSNYTAYNLVKYKQWMRERDFFYQVPMRKKCCRSPHNGFIKSNPRQQTGTDVNTHCERIVYISELCYRVSRKFCADNFREKNGEDKNLRGRLQNIPEDTEHRAGISASKVLFYKVPQ